MDGCVVGWVGGKWVAERKGGGRKRVWERRARRMEALSALEGYILCREWDWVCGWFLGWDNTRGEVL